MNKEELEKYNLLLWQNKKLLEIARAHDEMTATLTSERQEARAAKFLLEIKLEQEETNHKDDVHRMGLRIKDLEERLHREIDRANQALEIAENSSGSITSVTRLLGHTSDLVMALEVKLDNMNKEDRRTR